MCWLPLSARRRGTDRQTAGRAAARPSWLAPGFHRRNLNAPAARDLSPADLRSQPYQLSRRRRRYAFKLGSTLSLADRLKLLTTDRPV